MNQETSNAEAQRLLPAAHGWAAIETAPKDGTQILLYLNVLKIPVRVGHYSNRETYSHGKLESQSEGWTIYGDYFVTIEQNQPTHWMPLPLPPNVKAERLAANKENV
jgi:hypothetical protein